jgi:membrane protease YdiL (CAAX protease family)
VRVADAPDDRGLSIVVVLILLAAGAAAYELFGRGLALVLSAIPMPRIPLIRARRSDPEPGGPTGHRLRLWHVLGLVGAYFGAMLLLWIAGAIAAYEAGPDASDAITRGMLKLAPALLPASGAAGGLVVLLGLRRWARRLDPATYLDLVPSGWGTRRQLLGGAAAGVALGAAFVLLAGFVTYHPTNSPSLMALAAATSGAARWAWAVTAVLLAPPVEEALFRGVVLGGLARAWGIRVAMVLSGGVFWLLHASEWSTYWPGAVAIGLLTLLVTVLRVRTRSLGPCIAAHLAYNLVLVLFVFALQSRGTS